MPRQTRIYLLLCMTMLFPLDISSDKLTIIPRCTERTTYKRSSPKPCSAAPASLICSYSHKATHQTCSTLLSSPSSPLPSSPMLVLLRPPALSRGEPVPKVSSSDATLMVLADALAPLTKTVTLVSSSTCSRDINVHIRMAHALGATGYILRFYWRRETNLIHPEH